MPGPQDPFTNAGFFGRDMDQNDCSVLSSVDDVIVGNSDARSDVMSNIGEMTIIKRNAVIG